MKVLVFFGALLISIRPVFAQSEKVPTSFLVLNGSYSYFNAEQQLPDRSFTNRRLGYLQASYMAELSERNLFGIHTAWQEATNDLHTLSAGINTLHLERTRFLELGLVYRRQRKFLKEKLVVFMQANADAVFAKQRGQAAGLDYSINGSGARLQVRPGFDFVVNKNTAIEFGFGRADVLFMQWPETLSNGASGNSLDFGLNTNFNLSSVFIGLKLGL